MPREWETGAHFCRDERTSCDTCGEAMCCECRSDRVSSVCSYCYDRGVRRCECGAIVDPDPATGNVAARADAGAWRESGLCAKCEAGTVA